MSVTLLLIAAGVFLLVALYAIAFRPHQETVLAGQYTTRGLSDPASETFAGPARIAVLNRAYPEWQLTNVQDLTAAEDLLDCLESRGIQERELIVLGESCFAIRWR